MRNLFKDGFTAEDFENPEGFFEPNSEACRVFASIANALLNEAKAQAKKVYTIKGNPKDWPEGTWVACSQYSEHTHTALLICEEEIKT